MFETIFQLTFKECEVVCVEILIKLDFFCNFQALYMNIQELAVMAKVRKAHEPQRTSCPPPIEVSPRSVPHQVQLRPDPQPPPTVQVPCMVESKCVTNPGVPGD